MNKESNSQVGRERRKIEVAAADEKEGKEKKRKKKDDERVSERNKRESSQQQHTTTGGYCLSIPTNPCIQVYRFIEASYSSESHHIHLSLFPLFQLITFHLCRELPDSLAACLGKKERDEMVHEMLGAEMSYTHTGLLECVM